MTVRGQGGNPGMFQRPLRRLNRPGAAALMAGMFVIGLLLPLPYGRHAASGGDARAAGKCLENGAVPVSPETTAGKIPGGKAADATGKTRITPEEAFYRKALGYHRRNMLKKAVWMYRQVLKRNPEHPGALFNLSAACIRAGLFPDALEYLGRLLRLDPGNCAARVNLAIAEIGMGEAEKALADLDKAEGPGCVDLFEIYFHRGVALSRIGRFDDALVWYEKAEKLRPDDLSLRFLLCKYLCIKFIDFYVRIVPSVWI